MDSSTSPLTELPAIGFLADVSLEHRAFLTAFGRFYRPKKGEAFIHEGRPHEFLSLVLVGKLRVLISPADHPMRVAELGAGDVIGEINLFDPSVASATVVARDDCLIWSMTCEELQGIVEADSEAGQSIMWGLLRQMSRRIRRTNEKLIEFRELSARIIYESNPYDHD